ncbi:MAG: hypothetical protein EPN48_18500 [Microbacteriaceae bacterium]|nr:MAG: hypothetical protein EPN48_18500 [Microbacteriaceae bacterium]
MTTTTTPLVEIQADDHLRDRLTRTLDAMPGEYLAAARGAHITIRMLEHGERFGDIDRRFTQFDGKPPGIIGGLYCRDRAIVVLARLEPFILAHELSHVADAALGDGTCWRSQLDDRIARAYRSAKNHGLFISAYAQVNILEYAAEAFRAACGYGPPRPAGRPTDLERLARIDPLLVEAAKDWLGDLRARFPLASTTSP